MLLVMICYDVFFYSSLSSSDIKIQNTILNHGQPCCVYAFCTIYCSIEPENDCFFYHRKSKILPKLNREIIMILLLSKPKKLTRILNMIST